MHDLNWIFFEKDLAVALNRHLAVQKFQKNISTFVSLPLIIFIYLRPLSFGALPLNSVKF